MIRVEDEGGLRVVTLDRPDKANALSQAMLGGLVDAVRGVGAAQVLVLTGAGPVLIGRAHV